MLQEVFDNKYISTTITIALGLYAALLGPDLPPFIKDLFNNTIFRIFILFLVVVRGNQDPKMAIMIAVAFVLTLDYIYAKSAKETFMAVETMCDDPSDASCGFGSIRLRETMCDDPSDASCSFGSIRLKEPMCDDPSDASCGFGSIRLKEPMCDDPSDASCGFGSIRLRETMSNDTSDANCKFDSNRLKESMCDDPGDISCGFGSNNDLSGWGLN
jgi:hypothetical protein